MKTLKNLKGYSQKQRDLAYMIRDKVLKTLDLSKAQNQRLFDRVMEITSPMFFIKYRKDLESGLIIESLSDYKEKNYRRKADYVTNENGA
ncbi:TPA: hypothetical protein ACMD15_003418 [Vibrio cholerae]